MKYIQECNYDETRPIKTRHPHNLSIWKCEGGKLVNLDHVLIGVIIGKNTCMWRPRGFVPLPCKEFHKVLGLNTP